MLALFVDSMGIHLCGGFVLIALVWFDLAWLGWRERDAGDAGGESLGMHGL